MILILLSSSEKFFTLAKTTWLKGTTSHSDNLDPHSRKCNVSVGDPSSSPCSSTKAEIGLSSFLATLISMYGEGWCST